MHGFTPGGKKNTVCIIALRLPTRAASSGKTRAEGVKTQGWQGETGYFLSLSVKICTIIKILALKFSIYPLWLFLIPLFLFSLSSSLCRPLSLSLPPAGLICRSCSWTLSSTVSGKKQSDQCEKARGAHGQANQWWKEPCPGPYANGSTSRNLGSEHAH